MFCHEGSFFKFYDIDALVANRLCGYKIIPCGKRPKAGVPLSNLSFFERLERENISYLVFKKDEGVLKRFDAPKNMYKTICDEIASGLDEKGIKVETYFSTQPVKQNKLEFLASGFDPYNGEQVIGMSKETSAWLKMVADFLKQIA